MIIVFLGEMVSDRGHFAELLSFYTNWPVLDGDSFLPPALLEKKHRYKSFSVIETEDYIANYLLPEIAARHKYRQYLIVSLAYYRDEYRKILETKFGKRNITWVYIEPPSYRVYINRSLTRPNGLRWLKLALTNKLFFQIPNKCLTISNVSLLNPAHLWRRIIAHIARNNFG